MTKCLRAIAASLLLTGAAFVISPAILIAAEGPTFSPRDLEFFEKQVRPLLVARCYECHSETSDEVGGGLRLDARSLALAGGDSGPAFVPHEVEGSLLIESIRYGGTYEMPPDSKLPESEIAILARWVELGAPWPPESINDRADASEAFSIDDRKARHWAWSPIADPGVPQVRDEDWARDPIDNFVLAELEARGLQPTTRADRHRWLRRVTFDLTGLPPTLDEMEAFLADDSPQAHQRVVDRLLVSPRYGEHWARHWMDLIRYGETKAHESDYAMPFTWRYRDYLIRALNRDVPFDQFVREAIAGDLLAEPRTNPDDGSNESANGPGFFQMTDGHHGPPDIHMEEARVFDGMIDTTGKAFLGMTVGCARCHDHKFDAVSTEDYYALYGILASSRLDYPNVVSAELLAAKRAELEAQQERVKRAVLVAARQKIATFSADALADHKAAHDPAHPLYPLWRSLSATPRDEASENEEPVVAAVTSSDPDAAAEPIDLGGADFAGWKTSGIGFGTAPRSAGTFVIARTGDDVLQTFVGSSAAAGHLSSRIDGSIKSPMFVLADRVSLRVKGLGGRARLYIQHYDLVGHGPTTQKLDVAINKDHWHWVHFDTRYWQGRRAYVEVLHNGHEMVFPMNAQHKPRHHNGAYVAVDRVLLSSEGERTPRWQGQYDGVWGLLSVAAAAASDEESARGAGATPDGEPSPDVVEAARGQLTRLLDRWQWDQLSSAEGDVVEALLTAGGPLAVTTADAPELAAAVEQYRAIWRSIPEPVYVRSMTDGFGTNEPVYIRGNPHATSSEAVPRRFLAALDGRPFETRESGRREWAEALVADDNPLVARVIVNRLWQRMFGRGIVATVDNFGEMGERPSHPELLDYLAREFVRDGWSRKRLLRRLALSSTYRLGTTPSTAAAELDPENLYLQRMPIRRLLAEPIRDAILAASGSLRHEMYGPSVPVNLDQAPPSRSIPEINGPLDGDGRRSVYLEMRRNYLPGFLTAFDLPTSAEPRGRRDVTNVPAQSLAMMNDPFVIQQATAWAERLLADERLSLEQRIDRAHRLAYSRPAREGEIERARRLLGDLAAAYDVSLDDMYDDVRVWKDFCHLMLNRKEFIFIY